MPDTATVTARAVIQGHHVVKTKKVVVQPFVPEVGIDSISALSFDGQRWAPTSVIHVGELVRFIATYDVTELAGNFVPPCVSGSFMLVNATATMASSAVHCSDKALSNGVPFVYVDTRVTDLGDVGMVTATFALSYPEGMYGIARGTGSAQFSVAP
jgi:hypothetical protein